MGQLHQIRGRVGRSEKQGYAYMLLPENSSLSVVAKKRLVTIEKNVSLGSGYHIAKSDLNIRGGGLLFGFKQSGKSFDFGFEFYSKLMSSIDCSDSNIVLSFNSSFNKGEQLFKFLSGHAKDFDILSYSFDQREHVTLLNLKHNNNNINGEFLVDFFKAFKAVL